MSEQDHISVEQLRANYYHLIGQSLPQRARGIPYANILGPSALVGVVLGVILAYAFAPLIHENPLLFWGTGFVLTWLFFFFPAQFYDDRKRTYQHASRHYPVVIDALMRLKENENKEFLFRDLPLLKIDGHGYFLAAYIYQRWWDPTPNVKFTGWVIMTDSGEVIADDEFFEKVFLTYSYESLGAVTTQQLDGESRMLSNDLRYQLPQAEMFLRSQHNYFDKQGGLQDWQNLMDSFPTLYEAGKEALTLYKGRENFRRAMGYSFGLEFEYEDALLEEKMNRGFSQYMLAAYGRRLDALRASLTRLLQSVENDNRSIRKRLRLDSLNQVQETTLAISNLIVRMQQIGIPTHEDWVLYRTKLALAKKRGFVIAEQPRRTHEALLKG